MSSWGLVGSSPATLGVALAGGIGFLCRAPTLGSLSYVTYVRPFLQVEHGGSIPEGQSTSLHTVAVVALFWAFDKAVGRGLLSVGSRVPSSIAAMLLSFGGMIAVQALAGAEVADSLNKTLRPGVHFLGRYMMSFLTVVVVPIPAAVGELWGQGGATTLAKVLFVHWAGWCLTHFSTAAVVRVLGGGSSPSSSVAAKWAEPGTSAAPVAPRSPVRGPRLSTSLADYRKSDNLVEDEHFAQPSPDELQSGQRLVARRVEVEGYGPGTIVAFTKTYLQGASTHDIEFDSTGEKLTLKLARKSNVSTHVLLCRKRR